MSNTKQNLPEETTQYNKPVQLITYVDRLSGAGVPELHDILKEDFGSCFAGVHLLPFYTPIDGEDAGFDPTDHTQVDPRLGNWQDVQALGADFPIMADMIVNHVSAQSAAFTDVVAKGKESQFWDFFLTKQKVYGDADSGWEDIYRPRPTSPFTPVKVGDGESVDFWTTFTSNQIDIDVNSALGKRYLDDILQAFAANNVKLIRLDAAGYAIKQAGTNCFMMPETFEFIADLSARAEALGMTCLVEIHSYHKIQCEIAERCALVYDFALPPLVLHSLIENDFAPLYTWLEIAPRNCVTVLDTHDGIGIVDVGADGDNPGLLSPEQIDSLVESIHRNSQEQSKKATGAAANNVDLYQVNCTYFDALARDEYRYLLARAIQFFAPGIPQVYYAGLLGCVNDMDLLASSQVGRDINRPYLNREEVKQQLQQPFVKGLITLINKRNASDAFAGEFSQSMDATGYHMQWVNGQTKASLHINTELEAQVTFDNDSFALASLLD